MAQTSPSDWRDKMKCRKLTPEQADQVFFPKPGGKSKTARLFCEGCDVIDKCLNEQLRLGGPGFWAGTTEEERRHMVEFLGLLPMQLDDFIPPVTRPRLRRVVREAPLKDLLADVEGPTEEELKELEA
jgi:hypothetical protein